MAEEEKTIQLANGVAKIGDEVICPEKGVEGHITDIGEDSIAVAWYDGTIASHNYEPLDFCLKFTCEDALEAVNEIRDEIEKEFDEKTGGDDANKFGFIPIKSALKRAENRIEEKRKGNK